MENKMEAISYSSIGQFRNLVKDVQFAYKEKLPILTMTGTVKVHGTNASVIITHEGNQYPQSKNNIITVDSDNHGFALWHNSKTDTFKNLSEIIRFSCSVPESSAIIIYGEWAGQGVQKGVAVSEACKFFYIFGVMAVSDNEEKTWLSDYPSLDNYIDIYDARDIWIKKIDIDFNTPSLSQNELVSITNEVESECPVGKSLGFTGVGEGVVWEYITNSGERFSFKVKGEKHSVTKVKKLAEVDTEKVNSIEEFIAYAVTDNRLNQAFLEVCDNEADRKLLGKFLKWINSDVNKEESDTLKSNGLTMKDVGGSMSKRAKNWFFSKELI